MDYLKQITVLFKTITVLLFSDVLCINSHRKYNLLGIVIISYYLCSEF